MQMASSAKRTCSELRSASEYTATVLTPNSRQAERMRRAISPRLAIRIFRNMGLGENSTATATAKTAAYLFFPVGAYAEEGFAVFYRMTVLDENAHDFAGCVRFDLVH